MIKFYIPDGHLEERTLQLFRRAGFEISMSERGYNPDIDDPEIVLKRIRPQDFPFVVSLGKGDLAVTGSDILEDFRLGNPKRGGEIKKIMDLGFGATRLVTAISEEMLPDIESIKDFSRYSEKLEREGKKAVVATEYYNIAKKYLQDNGINAIIDKPAGKTEAWIIPPTPEADLIIETMETGKTIRENRCRIIDEVMEASSVLIANRKSLQDEKKKKKISEIVDLFRGALKGKGKVNVFMNIMDDVNLQPVLDTLSDYVEKPTINDLRGGGYDVFIVIDEKELKYLLPKLRKTGASSIAISDTRMLIS
ncbi:MAG: ATP phosphoribosyltransferase [Candidatus Altiarchaeales archaeon ex4484_2]|nr:MAG: ATP phosphoribosyltransferase [Candidatus Altiarchaeales archaeon ex4484_2]